jgi:hypothetical protein
VIGPKRKQAGLKKSVNHANGFIVRGLLYRGRGERYTPSITDNGPEILRSGAAMNERSRMEFSGRAHVTVLTAFALLISLAVLFASGCKSAEERKKEISQAIVANDVNQLKALLPKEGKHDFDAETYKAFLVQAGDEYFARPWKIAPRLRWPVIITLAQRYRHVEGKPLVATGKLRVGLVAVGPGEYNAQTSLTAADGTQYQVRISTEETQYVGTSLGGEWPDQQFLADFDATYRISGYVVGKFLESDKVELIQGGGAGHGMALPVDPFLLSTEEITESDLPKDGSK